MEKEKQPLKCYIAAFQNKIEDNFLVQSGFSRGIISFSIPDYGIIFRCRSDGKILEMEFAVFFSLLKFITTKLSEQKIKKIMVFSSNPGFIFSFAGNNDYLKKGSENRQLLDEFSKSINISIAYIKPLDNKALISPADYPSLPEGKKINLTIDKNEMMKAEFKPFQKGIKL